ncbi:MAG: CPBP family intramembrane metalloprotease, partial [Burkholderiales bacterium]|nr:CPBP family intramembrane metalloprotease [Anaerolineae bacterium]
SAWVAAVLLMVLAQPIAEELVFRGILFPALRAATGAWAGLFLSALLYGTFHLLTYAPPQEGLVGVWYGLFAPLLAGLVIGGIRAYTGSTRAAIVMHVGFGIFAVLKALTITG